MSTISAEAHSDDRVFEVDFDATPWFATATDEQITELAACGWANDYPADAVVNDLIDHGIGETTDDLTHMMAYVTRKKDMGFECSVEEDEAMAWLDANKPELAATIRENQEKGSW
jgi:hypothetical protein